MRSIAMKHIHASLTRITDLSNEDYDVQRLDRSHWATGDYVLTEVRSTSRATQVELVTGRMSEVTVGDQVVGALGVRAATLEAVGSWQAATDDQQLHAMTAAGIVGRVTSQSSFIPNPMGLGYLGHVVRNGNKLCMKDFVGTSSGRPLDCPVILLIGTSMSSGKTTSARVIIRRLCRMGLRVAGAKLTGAGRYRDILAMSDAGAETIHDFVDVGLPSTVCDPTEFEDSLDILLSHIGASEPDVLVAEAGASPLEPYNGDVAVKRLKRHVRCTVLCASDPYAVVGVTKGFGFDPDLVTGVAASTSAGVDVIRKLAEQPALNLLDPNCYDELDQILVKVVMR